MKIDLACPNCAHCLMSDEAEAFIPKMGKMEICEKCGEQFEVKKKHFQKHLTPEQRKKAMAMKAKTKAMMEEKKVASKPKPLQKKSEEAVMTESKVASMVDAKVNQRMEEEKEISSSGVFYLVMATLIAGIILIFEWVGNMALIQRPDIALNIIAWLVVLQTSIAVAFDTKSISWLFGMLLLWFFALPYYAIKRTSTGGAIGIVMLVLIFVFAYIYLAISISEAANKVSNIMNAL